jgi:predicted nucleotidyltransferase
MEVPMRRDEALRILREHKAELDAMDVRSLSVFGSVARDEAGPESDVDLLVEFARPVGYFHFFGVQEQLETWLKRRVDLVTPGGLKRQLRDRILAEAVRAA